MTSLNPTMTIGTQIMDGSLIRTARVYYFTLWVAGHILTHPAILNEDSTLVERMPEIERLHFKFLWAGYSQTSLDKVVEPDTYFMGAAYRRNQSPDLIKTFSHLFEDGKNTELRVCTAFSDGDRLDRQGKLCEKFEGYVYANAKWRSSVVPDRHFAFILFACRIYPSNFETSLSF